jgi:hypothetical protein
MGKRKAVWLHVEQAEYLTDLADADGVESPTPSIAIRKLIVLMRRAGIENLDQFKARLEQKVIAVDSSRTFTTGSKPN